MNDLNNYNHPHHHHPYIDHENHHTNKQNQYHQQQFQQQHNQSHLEQDSPIDPAPPPPPPPNHVKANGKKSKSSRNHNNHHLQQPQQPQPVHHHYRNHSSSNNYREPSIHSDYSGSTYYADSDEYDYNKINRINQEHYRKSQLHQKRLQSHKTNSIDRNTKIHSKSYYHYQHDSVVEKIHERAKSSDSIQLSSFKKPL